MNIFITGTDTDVGKTIISAWLCLHLKAYYWKPVQSGCKDSIIVQNLLNGDESRIIPEKYVFKTPVSPHLAASIEGKTICMEEFSLPNIENGKIIVEGAGGILVPLNDESTVLSLVKKLDLPIIIVASSRIGTINHTWLTIEAIRKKNIPILGVIMNGPKNEANRMAIEKYGKVSVLDELEPFEVLSYSALKAREPSHKLLEAVNDFSTVR